jgi:hypothetical protein
MVLEDSSDFCLDVEGCGGVARVRSVEMTVAEAGFPDARLCENGEDPATRWVQADG